MIFAKDLKKGDKFIMLEGELSTEKLVYEVTGDRAEHEYLNVGVRQLSDGFVKNIGQLEHTVRLVM